jgi:chromosome segregation protein
VFLRRVTITGFKSFANKTVIDLEPGITGVVGPNGSGKSNIADAVRWGMGEQRGSRLRLGVSEDVVFAGNDKRARASYAEVTLLFNNEDGAFGLDLTEVEIGRRMYRSGETDYRLAGRSVRLSDIQSLLVAAGVGASTYAVIGQGMIDSILMSSPSERKLLFDEAAGIRGPELGREAALRKLNATATNLTRLRDIAAELAPRLGTLEKAVSAADERKQLEARVTQLRDSVTSAARHEALSAIASANARLTELAMTSHTLRHQRQSLEREQVHAARALATAEQQRQSLTTRLAALESSRDLAAEALSVAREQSAAAAREAAMARSLEAEVDAAARQSRAAKSRLEDIRAQQATNADAVAGATKAVDKATREVATAQASLVAVREGTADGARDSYVDHALAILKDLAIGLGTPDYTEGHIRLLVHKAGRLLSHASGSGAAELLSELKTAQKLLESAMARRETSVEHQTNIAITGRSLEIDLVYLQSEVTRLADAEQQLSSQLKALHQAASGYPALEQAEQTAEAELAATTSQLEVERERAASQSAAPADIAAAAQLLSELERINSAIAGLAGSHKAAVSALTAAKLALRESARQAKQWGIDPDSEPPVSQSLDILHDQLARAETLLEAKNQMYEEHLGEYEEVTHRQSELTAQIADLEVAENDLRHLVGELDKLIRNRFTENFQALAEQFSHYFTRLFEGGTASLELTKTDNDTYGITIKASPKGKRLAAIAALSGGERAMAGVALVAAILKVNPSPFVVLDEIDAALDEANSGRLASILAELQQYSQLIVITHNRQTMNAAQVLFGVTMNEHHISHLISMRLEQAAQMAAR